MHHDAANPLHTLCIPHTYRLLPPSLFPQASQLPNGGFWERASAAWELPLVRSIRITLSVANWSVRVPAIIALLITQGEFMGEGRWHSLGAGVVGRGGVSILQEREVGQGLCQWVQTKCMCHPM